MDFQEISVLNQVLSRTNDTQQCYQLAARILCPGDAICAKVEFRAFHLEKLGFEIERRLRDLGSKAIPHDYALGPIHGLMLQLFRAIDPGTEFMVCALRSSELALEMIVREVLDEEYLSPESRSLLERVDSFTRNSRLPSILSKKGWEKLW